MEEDERGAGGGRISFVDGHSLALKSAVKYRHEDKFKLYVEIVSAESIGLPSGHPEVRSWNERTIADI
jgi:hypothetical protein